MGALGSSRESQPGSRARSKSSASSRKESRALHAALQANAPVDADVKSIAANSLGAKRVGKLNFQIARQFVSQVVLVTDMAIVEAQRRLWTEVSVIAEPGGAAAFAALASGAYRPKGDERVGVLVCGANADLAAFAQGGQLAPPFSDCAEAKSPCQPLRWARARTIVRRLSAGVTSLAARWGVAKW